MKYLLIILSTLLISCDDNPLGKTSLSSCDHSPNTNVGLPLTCQVSIPFTENMFSWLDAHDSGTLELQNQTQVVNWFDKSGNGTNLTLISGTHATQKKKSSNERNAILFNSAEGGYSTGFGMANFPPNQSFTMGISLKTGTFSSKSFELSNNDPAGFKFTVDTNGNLTYSSGTIQNVATGISLQTNTVYKFIITYDQSVPSMTITNGLSINYTGAAPATSNSWIELLITGSESFEINEILIYTALPEAQDIQKYLDNKWGF
ncbi:MAG: hypothetical protein ACRBBP_08460 [Bdellovibrionales bacterium]